MSTTFHHKTSQTLSLPSTNYPKSSTLMCFLLLCPLWFPCICCSTIIIFFIAISGGTDDTSDDTTGVKSVNDLLQLIFPEGIPNVSPSFSSDEMSLSSVSFKKSCSINVQTTHNIRDSNVLTEEEETNQDETVSSIFGESLGDILSEFNSDTLVFDVTDVSSTHSSIQEEDMLNNVFDVNFNLSGKYFCAEGTDEDENLLNCQRDYTLIQDFYGAAQSIIEEKVVNGSDLDSTMVEKSSENGSTSTFDSVKTNSLHCGPSSD